VAAINNPKPALAFLGLGYMGSRMAARLVGAGYPLTVWNRDAGKAKPLADAGARMAGSAPEAVQGAQIVVSMLANDEAARAVLLGEGGVVSALAQGQILVEMSTLSPGLQREISAEVQKRGAQALDCPVSGSTPQAEQGQLVLFAGGEKQTFETVKPILMAMGQAAHFMGPSGSGAVMKLVVNALLGIGIQAVAEGLALGEKAGLDRNLLIDTLAQTTVVTPAQKSKLENAKQDKYLPNFPLRLLFKDYGLVADEARAHSVPMPTLAAAQQMCAVENARGEEEDMSAVIKLMRSLSQIE